MPKPIILSVTAILLAGAPLAAQNSVRDYTLPPPTPTATPQVQGPADDSGVIPVGPRVIPAERPSPRPTASPAAQPSPLPTPAPSANASAPTVQPRPVPGPAAQPASRSTPLPVTPSPAPLPVSPDPNANSPLDAGISLPPIVATPEPETTEQPTEVAQEANFALPNELQPYWIWILGAFGLLIGVPSIWLTLRRRRSQTQPPEIEPPLAPRDGHIEMGLASNEKAKFDTRVEVESLSRSFRMVTVKYRVEITNRGGRALRDLTFGADLVSVARGTGDTDQLAHVSMSLPTAGSIDRVGPHQTRNLSGSVQMPIEAIQAFAQGQVPMFIPLLRLRIDGPEIGAEARTYALGLGGASDGRINPLPLDNPLGSYQGVRAVRVDPG